jgi:hypothetical protein
LTKLAVYTLLPPSIAVKRFAADLLLACLLGSGHSKGGNDVLLYASIYDDIPVVVNIAGRLYMDRGIKERFGEGILDEIKSNGFKAMKSRRSDGTEITWQLTPEVRTEGKLWEAAGSELVELL